MITKTQNQGVRMAKAGGWLLVLCLIAGLYSVSLGQDINFDLLNYHLYTPFAFLNGHLFTDVAAAGIHSFFNPLPDLYFYFLFQLFFDFPRLHAFFMGVPYGVLLWCTYYTVQEIFDGQPQGRPLAWLAWLIGCTGAGILCQIGQTTNDILLANGIVISLWLAVKFIKHSSEKHYIYWAAGLAGLSAGLKLTLAPYCVALTALLLLQWKRMSRPGRVFGVFSLCGVAGFLLANGYFMWKWYQLYDNPLFPYYNHIFRSAYFDPVYLTDFRFHPNTVWKWLFYPFFWAVFPSKVASEWFMKDMRLAGLWLAMLGWAVAWFYKRNTSFSVLWKSLVVYSVVGYGGWLLSFGLVRHGIVLEILSGIMVVGLIGYWVPKRYSVLAATGILGLFVLTTQSQEFYHNPFDKQLIVFENKPKIEDNSLVFFMAVPLAYLAPLLNPHATYMGGVIYPVEQYPDELKPFVKRLNTLPREYLHFHFEDLQRQAIASHQGPIYVISVAWKGMVSPTTLARFDLQGDPKDCRPFSTNVQMYLPSKPVICRVYKIKNIK